MPTVVECPRDPGVETALRCSRCETPICPACLIQSPVGARCRDCAKMVRNPIYTLNSAQMVRAGAAAIIGGIVMGLIWGFVLLPFTFGSIFFVIILGAGLGFAFTKVMEFATGSKARANRGGLRSGRNADRLVGATSVYRVPVRAARSASCRGRLVLCPPEPTVVRLGQKRHYKDERH